MRKETSEKVCGVRQETKKALDKIGIEIVKEGGKHSLGGISEKPLAGDNGEDVSAQHCPPET